MQWVALVLGGINLVTTALLVPLLKRLTELRDQELRLLREWCNAIEHKIDEHLQWHMNHK